MSTQIVRQISQKYNVLTLMCCKGKEPLGLAKSSFRIYLQGIACGNAHYACIANTLQTKHACLFFKDGVYVCNKRLRPRCYIYFFTMLYVPSDCSCNSYIELGKEMIGRMY